MAAGALALESQVEHYVVEPLLRLVFERRKDVTWKRSYRIRAGVPDYVVMRDDTATGVVEVKLGVIEPRDGVWSGSPDFQQVMRYSDDLGVPAALVDSNRIFLIPAGGVAPKAIMHRNDFAISDLALVGRHLSG